MPFAAGLCCPHRRCCTPRRKRGILRRPADWTPKSLRQQLHTNEVQNSIRSLGKNRILNDFPPLVAVSEQQLPRSARTRLAQLRSGYCSALGDYKNRINPIMQPNCPDCNHGRQDVQHLLVCPAKNYNIPPIKLWTDPIATITALFPDFHQQT